MPDNALNKKFMLLTVDVEDWFQVENFKSYISHASWSSRELRVEQNTHRLLDLFDSAFRQKTHAVRATFFILGWIARRLPNLIREIHARGHEVASHGMDHGLCNKVSPEALAKDLIDSRKLLEDIIGHKIDGYRAPSFSIDNDILKIIADCGYTYDSSYNSFAMHSRYGHIDIPQNGKKGIAIQISKTDHAISTKPTINSQQSTILHELPISNLKFKIQNFILPWGGGAYFRLMPFSVFRRGIKAILKKNDAYLFYMHPWEIDPDQPRVRQAAPSLKFRHYVNQKKTCKKLERMLHSFSHCRFASCREYLEELATERL